MSTQPLTATEPEVKLGEALDPVPSSRRTAVALTQALAEFERATRFCTAPGAIIAKTNADMTRYSKE